MILMFGPVFVLNETPKRNVVANHIIRGTDEDPKSSAPFVSIHWKSSDELFDVTDNMMYASSKSLTDPIFPPCSPCELFELRKTDTFGVPVGSIVEKITSHLPKTGNVTLVLDNYCIKTLLPILIDSLPKERIDIMYDHTFKPISENSKRLISGLGLKLIK